MGISNGTPRAVPGDSGVRIPDQHNHHCLIPPFFLQAADENYLLPTTWQQGNPVSPQLVNGMCFVPSIQTV